MLEQRCDPDNTKGVQPARSPSWGYSPLKPECLLQSGAVRASQRAIVRPLVEEVWSSGLRAAACSDILFMCCILWCSLIQSNVSTERLFKKLDIQQVINKLYQALS